MNLLLPITTIGAVLLFAVVCYLVARLRRAAGERGQLESSLAKARDDLEKVVREKTEELEKTSSALDAVIGERKQTERDFSVVVSGAGCLLWLGEVTQEEHGLNWQLKVLNEETRAEFLPLNLRPGQSWESGWYESRVFEDRDRCNVVSDDAIHSGKPGYTHEYRCVGADGRLRWFYENARVTVVGPGHWRIIGVCTDITDRKQREEELTHILKAARCLIWHSYVEIRDGRHRWNLKLFSEENADHFIPVKREPGQSWSDAFYASRYPEDSKRMDDTCWDALTTGKMRYSQEFRCRRSDGLLQWLYEDVKVERLGDNRWHLVGVCTDITNRKQAEEDLHRVIAGARCLLWHSTVDYRDGQFNWNLKPLNEEKVLEFMPLRILPGQSVAEAWFASRLPEDHQKMDERSRLAMLGGKTGYSQEFRCRRADGGIQWLFEEVYVQPLGPNRWHLVGVCTDITDRKKAEEELHYVITGAHCLLWHSIVEEVNGQFMWNIKISNEDSMQDFLPLKPKLGQSWADAWFECKLPEDGKRMDVTSEAALRGGQRGYSQEFRCKRADGEIRWLYEDVRIEPLKPGVWHLVGICADITQRKKAEEEREKLIRELQEALAKVKLLSGLLPICAACKKVRDDDGYWNQIDTYIRDHAEVEFSHSICPDCAKRLYPEYTGS
jgi:PAS domain-containing protein